ncbi:hypothetical protein [Micromonospora sp. NPDC049301]|uniref:hypothetical protein n=1 Tax=Micromonospora sp. NPDC049301 TaxID=3155723 RepID=UPI003429475E
MGSLDSLGFTRLIRTVIPGLLLSVTSAGYFDIVAFHLGHGTPVYSWSERSATLVIAGGLPLSIVFGIVSNMLVFGWATDHLIRKPFAHAHPAIGSLEAKLRDEVVSLKAPHWSVDLAGSGFQPDLEFILINEIQLEKITFLQESYWHYLEFQMNTAVAFIYATPLAVAAILTGTKSSGQIWLGVCASAVVALVVIALALFLVRTARVNFRKHRFKRLSLLLSAAYEVRKTGSTDGSDRLEGVAIRPHDLRLPGPRKRRIRSNPGR